MLEFFRGDLNRGAVGSLSTSQFISLFIFAAGVAMFAFCGKKAQAVSLKEETVSQEK